MEYKEAAEEYLAALQGIIGNIDTKQVADAMESVYRAYETGSTIYIFGNGGSAATASHLTCDFNKGVSMNLDKRFRFVCLNDNAATVMAYANDCGYENIFSLQLRNSLGKGDVVIAISGSGNSKNVVNAARYAKENGNTVVTMTGYSGGELLRLSDRPVHIPVNDMQKVEDCHMIVGHLMAQIFSKKLGHPMC